MPTKKPPRPPPLVPAPKKGMKFRVEVRYLGHKDKGYHTWSYQQDSRTRENAEKVASQARSWFGGQMEARVIEISAAAAGGGDDEPGEVDESRRPHKGGTAATPTTPAGERRHHPVPDVTDDVDRFDEAMHAFRKRLPVTRETWDELTREERRFAFTVSGVAQADMVLEVWEGVDRAIRDGVDIEDFKQEFTPKLGEAWGAEDASRVETIFRTNVQTAYNEGRYEVFSAPAVKEARPYFRFDAIDDDRVDDECADLNGTVLEQDDSFWDENHPPLHFNCRCMITALSQDEAEDEGIDDAPDTDHADDGFGDRPEQEGTDWEPDMGKYPDEIAHELQLKISDG